MDARADRLRVGALQAAAALVVPLAIVNGVLPLFAFAGLCAIAALAIARDWRRVPRGPAIVALALLAWAGLSLLWAIHPGHSVKSWATLALYTGGGLCLLTAADSLDRAGRARVGTALLAGVVATLLVLTVEGVPRFLGWTHTPQRLVLEALGMRFFPHKLNRTAALVAIAVWPAAAVLAQRHGWRRAWLLPAWAIAILPMLDSMAALLALACALPVAILAAWRAAVLRIVLCAAIAAGVAVMPALPNWGPFHERFTARTISGSIWHRAEIWSFAAMRIAERPILGWGLDTARAMPGGNDQIQPGVGRMPLHPHNGVLQLWLELGALGAALGAAAAVLAARRASAPDLDRAARIGMAAALAAALTVLMTGYGVWQAWWMGALWMIAAASRTLAPPRDTGRA